MLDLALWQALAEPLLSRTSTLIEHAQKAWRRSIPPHCLLKDHLSGMIEFSAFSASRKVLERWSYSMRIVKFYLLIIPYLIKAINSISIIFLSLPNFLYNSFTLLINLCENSFSIALLGL
jgi:hypothetical protein